MRVTDPQAIRALAHPLRLDLLEGLTANGPSTAAQCGYVEQAEPGTDRRERLWRVSAAGPMIRVDSGDNALLRREVERVVLDRETTAIRAYAERETTEDPAWQGSFGLVTGLLAVTPEEAAGLRARWKALL